MQCALDVSVISRKNASPSHNFFVEKTFKSCNPPDFKVYLSNLTKKSFPIQCMFILGLFSCFFVLFIAVKTDSKLTIHHMGFFFII